MTGRLPGATSGANNGCGENFECKHKASAPARASRTQTFSESICFFSSRGKKERKVSRSRRPMKTHNVCFQKLRGSHKDTFFAFGVLYLVSCFGVLSPFSGVLFLASCFLFLAFGVPFPGSWSWRLVSCFLFPVFGLWGLGFHASPPWNKEYLDNAFFPGAPGAPQNGPERHLSRMWRPKLGQVRRPSMDSTCHKSVSFL